MTHEDLVIKYNLNKKNLLSLYENIVSFLQNKGVNVSYINLEHLIETDIYKVERLIEETEKHHESCISDGAEVFLHEDIEDVGGICGRLYDILHVGCGHLWQWSSNGNNNLKFFGENAWEIGSTFYLGKSKEEIDTVWHYELEAGIIALSNLKIILNQCNYTEEFNKNIIQLFNDYMQTDLEYITSFYRTGQTKNFFENWIYNSQKIPNINIDFPLNIVRRTNKCVALIGVR
jgi:hypothetical protein